jgi:hypothetical protein
LSQNDIKTLNKPKMRSEIETVIKKNPTMKSPGMNGLTAIFHQIFKAELTSILPNYSTQQKGKEHFQMCPMKLLLYCCLN